MKILIGLISFIALLACMLMGIFGSAGFCAFIFGSEILDTVLGDEPDMTHPAFIIFISLMIPGMLIGAVGSIFGIILPLYQRCEIPLGARDKSLKIWLHRYALGLARYTESKQGEQGSESNS